MLVTGVDRAGRAFPKRAYMKHLHRGNSVLLPAEARDPQGERLSTSPDQTLSGGHMKAAGPISSSVTLALEGLSSDWAATNDATARITKLFNMLAEGSESATRGIREMRLEAMVRGRIQQQGGNHGQDILQDIACQPPRSGRGGRSLFEPRKNSLVDEV